MLQETSTQLPKLPTGVFYLRFNPRIGFYLERMSDKFQLPGKIYDTAENLINRVIKTWENTDTNLGVLLNGVRGTGKTIACEMLANQMKLPVIVIDQDYDEANSFLTQFQQDVIIFFDEFEKVFKRDYNSPCKLLMLMDGVSKGEYRKMFLLTTNELRVEENLIQRPGRIRYLKSFGNLTPDAVVEIIEDRLVHKQYKQQILEFITELELITVDIVCAIIDEVNIHNEPPAAFKDVFNIKRVTELNTVYEMIKDEVTDEFVREVVLHEGAKTQPAQVHPYSNGYGFSINREYVGEICEVFSQDIFEVQPQHTEKEEEEAEEKGVTLVDKPTRVFRLEPKTSYNSMFKYSAGKAKLLEI